MEASPEGISQGDDAEDLPSDFFDDFNKAEFMDGLSVVDECWEENAATTHTPESRTRIDMDTIDKVKDLRELIGDNQDESIKVNDKKIHRSESNSRKSTSSGKPYLDDYIKPGSRRDLSKTNEAIKKDKEVKVKQFLAKSLEASDNLRPPGTELDDFYEDSKTRDTKKIKHDEDIFSHKIQKIDSAVRQHRSPRPRYGPSSRRSPRPRRSPHSRYSPSNFKPRIFENRGRTYKDDRRYGTTRRSPPRRSPPRRSPRRYSPSYHSLRRQHSRSPHRRVSPRRSHSRSPHYDDNFLYPDKTNVLSSYQGNTPYQPLYGQYTAPLHPSYSGAAPSYPYPQIPAYGGFSDTYNAETQQSPSVNFNSATVPGMANPASPMVTPAQPIVNPASSIVDPVPPIVPAPSAASTEKATPYDALAQLVAEGKISKEDYLKLTPNKGVVSTMDTNSRVMVLTRCHQAISKLDKLLLPNHLIINNQTGSDEKYLAPKYCSPLKRQVITEFNFSRASMSQDQQTKQLVESIISTLGLDKVVTKYKKKLQNNMQDGVTQTTKSHCDVCQVREATKYRDMGTSTEPEYFTSTVHTQVVEQDLLSSRAVFNPSGSVGEGAGMSIAHLTPAQLVSQLAARAKTLKQPQETPPSNQFSRRPNNEFDGRGGPHYHHPYNNYRY